MLSTSSSSSVWMVKYSQVYGCASVTWAGTCAGSLTEGIETKVEPNSSWEARGPDPVGILVVRKVWEGERVSVCKEVVTSSVSVML